METLRALINSFMRKKEIPVSLNMIRSISIVSILFTMISCRDASKSEVVTGVSDSLTPPVIAVDSSGKDIIVGDQSKDTIVDGGDDQSGDETQLYHIVCVEEGDNYRSLRETGLKVSKFLGFKFDSLERYYDKRKKRVVLPKDHPDEIYAGEYFFRRYNDDFVSIEMRNAYPDPSLKDDGNSFFYSDTTKMFVFAAMYCEKKEADKLANTLKKQFKNTIVISSNIYMGCMH